MKAVTTSFALEGQNIIAQGFSPGFNVQERYALKGHPICGHESLQIDRPVPKQRHSGATREAVLGLPSPNCTPPRGVGSAFRALLPVMSNPGLKPWAMICNRFAVIRRQPARRSLQVFQRTGRSREEDYENKTKTR
jgi:hypothetical protein